LVLPLVQGLWGNPHDWRWVRGLLEDADVLVITPDLPFRSTPTAGLAEDAAEVRHAIRACAPPVDSAASASPGFAVVAWTISSSSGIQNLSRS
jgi:hypothetical protein